MQKHSRKASGPLILMSEGRSHPNQLVGQVTRYGRWQVPAGLRTDQEGCLIQALDQAAHPEGYIPLLPDGFWPQISPALRDWTAVEHPVLVPLSASGDQTIPWPLQGWKNMTAEEKLSRHHQLAMMLEVGWRRRLYLRGCRNTPGPIQPLLVKGQCYHCSTQPGRDVIRAGGSHSPVCGPDAGVHLPGVWKVGHAKPCEDGG